MSAVSVSKSSYQGQASAGFSIARHDIDFSSPRPDQVVVSLTLNNHSAIDIPPGMLRLQTAPLGAFVPWKPLADVFVPRIARGATHVVEVAFQRPQAKPLGRNPGDIPPVRLLTALAMDEPPRRDTRLLDASQVDPGTFGVQTGELAADLFELLGRSNPHWAGNLNVFVGHRAVERHLARALRIYPGRVNTAFFIVGCGRDAYAFELAGEGASWNAGLYHMLGPGTLSARRFNEIDCVDERRWFEVEHQAFVVLALRPPKSCESGNVEAHVTQRSTGRSTVIEFSLDPEATGPGCFVLES